MRCEDGEGERREREERREKKERGINTLMRCVRRIGVENKECRWRIESES
jgi:hypothetical protein